MASNTPTQSASNGAKTTRPFDATAAPVNLSFPVGEVMLMQLNTSVAASNLPIQSACFGAKTMRPFGAAAR